jgi:protein involved in polysaccharide export with SLBB domain
MIGVTVVGAAARPGVYELATGARLLDAVAAAGGVSALGDAKNVVLTRGTGGSVSGADSGSGQTAAGVDLDALGRDPKGGANTVLADGDVVYIPEAPEKLRKQVAVLGAVARPGVYPVDEGTRLMEAIAAAGGPLDAADLGRVKVYRAGDPADGVDLEVSGDRLVYDGDIKANPAIEPSSVVVVPGTEVRVYVAGSVARPGQVVLRRGATALDAIAAAGGVTSAGDGTRVALARKTGEGAFSLEIDVTSALDAGEASSGQSGKLSAKTPTLPMPLLEDGDALFVPEAVPGQVVVLGEVARPGAYRLDKGARVLDAIAAAGGATPKASLEKVSIFSEGVLAEPRYVSIGTSGSLLADGTRENPEVRSGDAIVVASRMISVNVIGAVTRPGAFELQPEATILDVMAVAGGVRTDGDAANVTLTRKGEAFALDVDAALAGGPAMALADGDVVFVPELRGQVLVLGEVARPGAYRLARGAKLLDAIAAAGGTTARASLESVTVYKDGALAEGSAQPIGYGKVLFSGKVTDNPTVNPGDVVSVGSRMMNVSVIGRAARPGTYELPVGARVIDAVAAAGGIAADGNGRSVLVIPAGKSGPSATVDLDQALRAADVGHTLCDGDVVFIPDTRRQVAVMGEVARPGVYVYTEGMTVMEILAMAGGPSAKADLAQVRLYRGERVEDALRLSVADDRLAFEGDIKQNPTLAPGDILYIPSGRIRVQVAGHVIRTGEFELRRGATILDAISGAGGLAPSGDGARVVITRRGEGVGRVVEADVEALLSGQRPQSEAAALEDGDVVFVPEALRKIVIMGGVARPGLYDYKQGMKLIDGLAMAGGPMAAARLDKIMLYTGEQAMEIALGNTTAKGVTFDPSKGNNPELKSGDIVIVPVSEKIDWSMIISILSAINQIKSIITR